METKRERLGVLTFVLSVVLFFAMYGFDAVETSASPRFESLPLFGKVIGVDAGHGGYDGGCEGSLGIQEKTYNLAIALKVGAEIEKLGGTAVYTRTEDVALIDPKNTPGYKKRKELDNRIEILQEASVDAMVSIHMNKYSVAKYRGAQAFYKAGSDAGGLLAGHMQEALSELGDPYLRQASKGDYYILNACDAALLVECGFLSNPEEERLLGDEAYQQHLAAAIAKGLGLYFLDTL